MPWTITKKDLKDINKGEGLASMGMPLHGLTAGLSAAKVLSPTYMLYNSIQGARNNGVKGFFDAGNHTIQDAVKDNLPVIMAAASPLLSGAGGGGAAGAAGAAGEAASVAPGAAGAASTAANIGAGLEGVTVTASQLPAWAEAVTAAGAIGGATAAANSGSQTGEPSQETPQEERGMLDRAWDYTKNPENWEQIATGVGAIGQLYNNYQNRNQGNPGTAPRNPGAPLDIVYQPRRFLNPAIDYENYGAGPEALFWGESVPDEKRLVHYYPPGKRVGVG